MVEKIGNKKRIAASGVIEVGESEYKVYELTGGDVIPVASFVREVYGKLMGLPASASLTDALLLALETYTPGQIIGKLFAGIDDEDLAKASLTDAARAVKVFSELNFTQAASAVQELLAAVTLLGSNLADFGTEEPQP